MLKILWKRGEIDPEEQFLRLSTILCYLMLDFYVKRGIRFSLRDKQLFEITEVEITRVDCIYCSYSGVLCSSERKRTRTSVGISPYVKENAFSCLYNPEIAKKDDKISFS